VDGHWRGRGEGSVSTSRWTGGPWPGGSGASVSLSRPLWHELAERGARPRGRSLARFPATSSPTTCTCACDALAGCTGDWTLLSALAGLGTKPLHPTSVPDQNADGSEPRLSTGAR